MPFWKCYFHVIWTTKHRQRLIAPRLEPIIFDAIATKVHEFDSRLLGINAVEDHVHVALMIPPGVAPAELIGQTKGLSSHAVNLAIEGKERFRWQEGYGILTFGEKNLDFVLRYIADQKTHHASGKIQPRLELTNDD
ncbi:MAG: transposase [Chloroflexota bacterium]|nr:MAG: transposase [Chloroflexota bacterium]